MWIIFSLDNSRAQDINAQIIDVMQGWLGIMQQAAVIKSFTVDGMWTLDDPDKAIPALMEANNEHDNEVRLKGAPQRSH